MAAIRFKNHVLLFSVLLFGNVAQAQMVAYKNGTAAHPVIDQSANGRPVVQIVRPNANGLSHNKFEQFNVDSNGVILNNSRTTTQTQLGGYIDGNPHLSHSANIILNEVMGVNRSQLNGYLEVAGQRADVIVANPNGITVGNGAGFINANRGVLTTGTPLITGDTLTGLRVTGGDIKIDGMNASQTNQLDIFARTVQINDALQANQLSIITGTNQIDYQSLGITIKN